MEKNLEENLFLLPGIVGLGLTVSPNLMVILSLTAVIFTEINLILADRQQVKIIMLVAFVAAGIFYPPVLLFLPVVAYEISWQENKWAYLVLLTFVWYAKESLDLASSNSLLLVFVIGFSTVAAAALGREAYKKNRLDLTLITLRDSAKEMELRLKESNRQLLERKDASVHMATLTERNRIAREIHDNVGHMLSRTILQLAALLTIYKDEPLNSQLQSINETVNEAMNNIRESVHDLHNDSLDLRQALMEATSDMRKNYRLDFDYDMSDSVDRNVKYCFISIVKEAMANITKHSNASQISLTLREHPGFYQLAVMDNGSIKPDSFSIDNSGIGLKNMTDRVEGLGGSIHFACEDGFKILISVPK